MVVISIGLPGIWVFVSVIIGSGLAGVLGVLLGVPMAASLYKLIALWIIEKEQDMNSRLKEKESRADP